MAKLMPMVDMAKTPEETDDDAISFPTPADQSKYPYGLSISLCEDELDKLGLSIEDAQLGDILHMHCLAVVTSVNQSASVVGGSSCRVELQITHIAAESEDEENEEEDKPVDKVAKLYTKK